MSSEPPSPQITGGDPVLPVDAAPPLATSPRPEAERAAGHRVTLAAVLLAVLVVPTSISGTAVALSDIGGQTSAGLTSLQWVVNAFNLTFACFTLAWGSVADIVGRAKAFALGAGIYLIASVASGLAGSIHVLDAARALAGIGGAAIFSCGSAILSTVFTGPARVRAFALFGTVAGIGVGVGPSFSGAIVESLGWRWIFGVHAIVLAVVLCATPVVLRTVADRGRTGARIDLPGAALFILAMLALTVSIVQGSQWGWSSLGVLGLFAVSLSLFAVFAAVQRRVAHPMLDLSVLRDRRYVGLCLVPVAASFGFVTMLTYLPSYLTAAAGRTAGTAGLIMVLLTIPVFVCPMLASALVNRGLPAETVLRASLVCLIVGDLALLVFDPGFSVLVVAVPLLVTGAGMGLSAGLVDGRALAIVPDEQAGMAAGFLNTMRLGSEAVAVAIYGAVFATLVHATISRSIGSVAPGADAGRLANEVAAGNVSSAVRAAGTSPTRDLTALLIHGYDDAFHTMLWILAAICAGLSGVILYLLRGHRNTQ
ncbi:MFS transporter [Actinoallomurus soli]|uniref:MFS transporter n=1 Tax=Actinoallomurus soli TaxID=2952535 RepID=UPI0020931A02|nr:MFS transporter [Actinoallomurus soli]MCO5968060.1 MFS transporter [Actinoallomurus soli]